MVGFKVVFYETEDGKKPVEQFLDELDDKMRAKVIGHLEILEEKGNTLREPLSAPLGDGIFELRSKQGSNIVRSLYFFYYGGEIVITNGFVKKTQKTPRAEITTAKDRRDDYIRRKDAKK